MTPESFLLILTMERGVWGGSCWMDGRQVARATSDDRMRMMDSLEDQMGLSGVMDFLRERP